MFWHDLKYAFKTMIKNKAAIIWTLIFPIALATFMYIAFGNLFEKDEVFVTVDTAVVIEKENEIREEIIKSIAGVDDTDKAEQDSNGNNTDSGSSGTQTEKDNQQLINVTYCTDAEARKLLEEGEVEAIIYVGDEFKLVVKTSNYKNAIVKLILEKAEKAFVMGMEGVSIKDVVNEELFTEVSTSDGNQSAYVTYFYAIFAMSCLFSSFGAVEKISRIQPNISALGKRRCMSSHSKMITVAAEYIVMLLFQFAIEVITLIYLTIIGVDFGSKYPQILVILFFGAAIGIAFGVIVGAIGKLSVGAKTGLTIGISMLLSVMADLVAHGIKDMIEHSVPIINRINPAALIVDSFYALNIYDTYDRYIRNIATLGGMAIALVFISILMLRNRRV